jgi:chromosomal replication initiation ATPase DnaA
MENTATLETLINLACTNLKVDLSELQAKYRGRAIVDKRRLLCHALAIRGFTVEKIGKALNREVTKGWQ